MKRYQPTTLHLTLLLLCFLAVGTSHAQTPLEKPHMSENTLISPYYFGPNAFPVPEMLDGTVHHDLHAELTANHYRGYASDRTTDLTLRVHIPLFTDRVNLTLWMPTVEWYKSTERRMRQCRTWDLAQTDSRARSGCVSGDISISTDIQVLKARRWWPDIAIRAAIKTASGNDFQYARYYDAPGYFADIALGRSILLGSKKDHDLRLAASAGFLCWQTANGRQNDATLFGFLLRWSWHKISLTESLRGYSGWEHNSCNEGSLAGDFPMVFKSQFNYRIHRHWQLQAAYQYGIQDYPFHQIQLGVAYNVNILK